MYDNAKKQQKRKQVQKILDEFGDMFYLREFNPFGDCFLYFKTGGFYTDDIDIGIVNDDSAVLFTKLNKKDLRKGIIETKNTETYSNCFRKFNSDGFRKKLVMFLRDINIAKKQILINEILKE